MKLRILLAIVLGFIALSVYADPYTHNLNGSDALFPAPLWQTMAAIIDIVLLIAATVSLLRDLSRPTVVLVATELLYALAFNAILIYRDGVERFIWGYGAQRHVLDFVVVFALRIGVLFALMERLRHREGRAA